eukprot:6180422-Pleurochrysis_carterae.AAC.2
MDCKLGERRGVLCVEGPNAPIGHSRPGRPNHVRATACARARAWQRRAGVALADARAHARAHACALSDKLTRS